MQIKSLRSGGVHCSGAQRANMGNGRTQSAKLSPRGEAGQGGARRDEAPRRATQKAGTNAAARPPPLVAHLSMIRSAPLALLKKNR